MSKQLNDSIKNIENGDLQLAVNNISFALDGLAELTKEYDIDESKTRIEVKLTSNRYDLIDSLDKFESEWELYHSDGDSPSVIYYDVPNDKLQVFVTMLKELDYVGDINETE